MNAVKLNLFKAIDFLIKVESGPDAGKLFRIQPPKIIIGREQSCQIILKDPKVSRQQCVIQFGDNIICLDLSSRKSTFVNGKPAHNQILRPGDTITFGDTTLKFHARANAIQTPQLQGQTLTKQDEKQQAGKPMLIFIAVMAVLFCAFLMLEETTAPKIEEKLATQSDVDKQIQESKDRTTLIRESYEKKKKLSENKYLYNVEKHFISGFRDFQNGQYGRAIDSFGTTIATDQSHVRALQYAKTARKQRDDLIDTHLQDGAKYKDKLMYNRCAAEFEKAIVLIDNVHSKKYELARTQYDECRLLKAGGY